MEVDRDKRSSADGPAGGGGRTAESVPGVCAKPPPLPGVGAKPPPVPVRLPPVAPLLSSGGGGTAVDNTLPRLAPVLSARAVGDLGDRRPLPPAGEHLPLGDARYAPPSQPPPLSTPLAGTAAAQPPPQRLPSVGPLLSVVPPAPGGDVGGVAAAASATAAASAGAPTSHPTLGVGLSRPPSGTVGGIGVGGVGSIGASGGGVSLPPLARPGVGVLGGPLLPSVSALSPLSRLYTSGIPPLTGAPGSGGGGGGGGLVSAAGGGGLTGGAAGGGVGLAGGLYYGPPPPVGVGPPPPLGGGGLPGAHLGAGAVPSSIGGHAAAAAAHGAPPPHPSGLGAVHYASGPAVVSLNEHERVVSSLQDQLLHARGEIDRLVSRLGELERERLATAAAHAAGPGVGGGLKMEEKVADGSIGGAAGGSGVGGSGSTGAPAPPAPAPTGAPPPKGQSRYWTPEEHQRFLDAMERFGPKDVRAIAAYVGSRNATQVRTHSQKYTLRLQRENRELPLAGTRKRSMSESDLRRVGRDGSEEPDRPFGGGGRPRRL
ncbi:hypothetical protein MMPV_005392 [Pyropia vietnamensis]